MTTGPSPENRSVPRSAEAPARPVRRSRARRGHGELLREEIVDATARLLAESGNENAVSIRSIARAVGVTSPSIYLHFADKSELLYAVCEDRFQALDRLSEQAAGKATDPLEELQRRGEAYIKFGLDNPEHYRILFMERGEVSRFDPERMANAACFGHMVDAVQRCIDAGLLIGDDAFSTTIVLWAAVHGITSLMIAKPEFPWPSFEGLIQQLLHTWVYGLLAPGVATRASGTGGGQPAAPTLPELRPEPN